MTKDEALKLALEALEFIPKSGSMLGTQAEAKRLQAIAALQEELTLQQLSKPCLCGKQTMAWCMANTCSKAQPEQEPVAFEKTVCPFCTSEWVTAEQHDRNVDRVERKPLTDEEIGAILEGVNAYGTRLYTFARAIEAKLKEKNT